MNRFDEHRDTLGGPDSDEQWQWLRGALQASEPAVDLDAIAAGVRERLRRRRGLRLRRWSVAAALVVAAGLLAWRIAPRSPANLADSAGKAPAVVRDVERPTRLTEPIRPTPPPPQVVHQPQPERTTAPTRTDVVTARRGRLWHDDLDRQLAGMQRDIWRVQASAHRLPTTADLIRGELEQLEQKIRRSTL